MRELHAAATRPRWEKLWAREEDSRSDISGGTSLSEPLQSLRPGLLDEVDAFPPPEGEAFQGQGLCERARWRKCWQSWRKAMENGREETSLGGDVDPGDYWASAFCEPCKCLRSTVPGPLQ